MVIKKFCQKTEAFTLSVCSDEFSLKHALSSRSPLFHYRFVMSLLCSRPRLSLPLFFTSLYYLFKVCIFIFCFVAMLSLHGYLFSLSGWYVTILSLHGSIVLVSAYYVTALF